MLNPTPEKVISGVYIWTDPVALYWLSSTGSADNLGGIPEHVGYRPSTTQTLGGVSFLNAAKYQNA